MKKQTMSNEEMMMMGMAVIREACNLIKSCYACPFDEYCKAIEDAKLDTPQWWNFTDDSTTF